MWNHSFDRWTFTNEYIHLIIGKYSSTNGKLIPKKNSSITSILIFQNSISSYNQSALIEYDKQRNSLANIRSTFAKFIPNIAILGSSSIQLQATMLVHLTQSTNELTRQTLVRDSFRSKITESFWNNRQLYPNNVINWLSHCIRWQVESQLMMFDEHRTN